MQHRLHVIGNAQSDEEYGEFIERCDDLHAELTKERGKNHYSFAELEENDAEVKKLKSWLSRIQTRDFFRFARTKGSGRFRRRGKGFFPLRNRSYESGSRARKMPERSEESLESAEVRAKTGQPEWAGSLPWLGLQERQRSAVWRVLPPIAVGHALSVGVIVALVAVIHATIPYQETSSDCGGSQFGLLVRTPRKRSFRLFAPARGRCTGDFLRSNRVVASGATFRVSADLLTSLRPSDNDRTIERSRENSLHQSPLTENAPAVSI